MLRIKIPCNRATSCNSSGKLKLPSSQCLRLACPRTDAHSASAVMIKRAYHCSRCSCGIMMQRIKIPCWLGIAQDLPSTWLVQEAWLCSRCAAELWIECHARSISITCMYGIWYIHVPPAFHARNLWRRFVHCLVCNCGTIIIRHSTFIVSR